MSLVLQPIEEEIVFLKAVVDLIDTMVNATMISVEGDGSQATVMFPTATHQQLFNVLLVDFLSSTQRDGPVTSKTYLDAMQAIAATPNFSLGDSIAKLRTETLAFDTWLKAEIVVDTWLPSLSLKLPLRLDRRDYLKMCGNLAKHNFLRSVRVAEQLRALIAKQGATITLEAAVLALDDFYERFHGDLLNYHSSSIAEFLNGIRWGVHEYLLPEFVRSRIVEEGDPAVISEFARDCYWNLMNDVRRSPPVRRFQITTMLKQRY